MTPGSVREKYHNSYKIVGGPPTCQGVSASGDLSSMPCLALFSGPSVGPMCLPEPGERFKAGLVCTTAGWGRLTESKNVYASPLNQMPELSVG